MNTTSGALLLVVQMNVQPEHEGAFNDWYHQHVPHLLEVDGYRWGRRYVGVFGPVKYLALYEIADAAWLPRLLGEDPSIRPPIVNDEFRRFHALSGLGDVSMRVFAQLSGPSFPSRLMGSDAVLSLVTTDCRPEVEEAFNRWYDESHVPNLLRVPGYTSGMRFRLVEEPAIRHLGTTPRYLALYEIDGESSVPGIADPRRMSPAAREEFGRFQRVGLPMLRGEPGWNIYRPLAKHWSPREGDGPPI